MRRLRKRVRYTPADYARETARYLAALTAGLPPRPGRPRPRLVVGGFAGSPAWVAALPALVDARRRDIGAVAAHRYGLGACALRPGDGGAAARGDLVQTATSRGRAQGLEPLVALAHGHGLPLWVAELNSAPCGGAPGASDRFAAAVWLTDTLFALARLGADRADVQTFDGAVYAPFAVSGDAVQPRPLFYGMLAFARAAPRGSRLVPVTVTGNDRVRAWGTIARDGTVRVALMAAVNARAVRVRVAVGAGRPCATVRITSAPSLAARTGIADRATRTVCPRGRAVALAVPGPSLSIVTLPPRSG